MTFSKKSTRASGTEPCSARSRGETSCVSKSICESRKRKHCVAVDAWNSSAGA